MKKCTDGDTGILCFEMSIPRYFLHKSYTSGSFFRIFSLPRNVISKKRYLIPLDHPQVIEGTPQPPDEYTLTIELDVFDKPFAPLVIAEVEFGSVEAAQSFLPPDWFGEEVTYEPKYHNSYMAMQEIQK